MLELIGFALLQFLIVGLLATYTLPQVAEKVRISSYVYASGMASLAGYTGWGMTAIGCNPSGAIAAGIVTYLLTFGCALWLAIGAFSTKNCGFQVLMAFLGLIAMFGPLLVFGLGLSSRAPCR